jgi:glyoxylase-like metal-dependent hydrolase (beta-lactamase superfamily II)
MASLERLLARDEQLYLPSHGGPVTDPARYVRGLRAHRKMRERAILERLQKGDRTIAGIVQNIYRDVDPNLHGAAALSVLAHLEELVARGLVATSDTIRLDGAFTPTS